MSWNWCSSTVFHIRSSCSYGYSDAGPHRGGRRPQLGLAQQVLAAPVALLGPGLAGQRRRGAAPGTAPPPTPAGSVYSASALAKKSARLLPGDLRRALQVRHPPGLGDHLARGPAAAVAVADRGQRHRGAALVLEVARGVRDLAALHRAVVGVDRREVREDPGAVDALPQEGVVRELVDLAPADLLGQRATCEPAALMICGSAAGEAEGVRQPGLVVLDAELLQEEALAVHELPGHRLASRACSCPTPPTCRRPGRSGPRRPPS